MSTSQHFYKFQNSKMELRKKQLQAALDLDNATNGDDVEDENHKAPSKLRNTTTAHTGADYTCVECLYNRWRSQANIKKPPPHKIMQTIEIFDDDVNLEKLQRITIERVAEKEPKEKETKKSNDFTEEQKEANKETNTETGEKDEFKDEVKTEAVDPVEIINSVNWLEVFKFVGISIPVIEIE